MLKHINKTTAVLSGLLTSSVAASDIPMPFTPRTLSREGSWIRDTVNQISPRITELFKPEKPLAVREKELSELLEKEYLSTRQEKNLENGKRLLKGLLQYILLERYNRRSPEIPAHCSLETTIYCNYHFYFSTYILDKTGEDIEKQVECALFDLDQDFTNNFSLKKVLAADRQNPVFSGILYSLDRLSDLQPDIIEILSNLHSTSLSEKISKIIAQARKY